MGDLVVMANALFVHFFAIAFFISTPLSEINETQTHSTVLHTLLLRCIIDKKNYKIPYI